MNHDNALSAVARLSLEQKTSKAGNSYIDGKLHLLNGYVIRLSYIDENLQQAIQDSLKMAQQHQHDNPMVSGVDR